MDWVAHIDGGDDGRLDGGSRYGKSSEYDIIFEMEVVGSTGRLFQKIKENLSKVFFVVTTGSIQCHMQACFHTI